MGAKRALLLACVCLVLAESADDRAFAAPIEDPVAKIKSVFHFHDGEETGVPLIELCKRLDCLAEQLRDDGLVVMKQPDVFSQARMTRFRTDFENQMSTDLANFHLVLAARINRLDAATTTQTTSLGAALAAPGTTNTAPTPPAPNFSPDSSAFSLYGRQIAANQGPFGQLGLATNNFAPLGANASSAYLGLGVDPTVYLDEKRRFLEHLNQIRRISLGPDQNDSSGYGLYLVRLPVSITPGERTLQGFGADFTVSVEHEFGPDFLASTFRNLVINDIADQLSPVIYEAIRSKLPERLAELRDLRDRSQSLRAFKSEKIGLIVKGFLSSKKIETLKSKDPSAVSLKDDTEITRPLTNFVVERDEGLTGDPAGDQRLLAKIARRLTILTEAGIQIRTGIPSLDKDNLTDAQEYYRQIGRVQMGDRTAAPWNDVFDRVGNVLLYSVLSEPHKLPANVYWANMRAFRTFVEGLYDTASPEDVQDLATILEIDADTRKQMIAITSSLAAVNAQLAELESKKSSLSDINLPATRSAKQLYPIPPHEVVQFFLLKHINTLAKDVKSASRTGNSSPSEIRAYLRHALEGAYATLAEGPTNASGWTPPLADPGLIGTILQAVRERRFDSPAPDKPSTLESLSDELSAQIELVRRNVKGTPLAALAWAVAVDAALLNEAMRNDAAKVFRANGLPADEVAMAVFHRPPAYTDDLSRQVFQRYVQTRWPIITFSIDPVTDQQNIADSFNLKRDLQLALSYAFSTGQISFNQLNTFRRQIEQSSDTIALNRTVTGFTHSNDTFGFRFTPRFQNPPNQRTNLAVITSQLISGGPGPDYQIKKSKLEAGQRELTAVLLIPTFLPTLRMNVSANWFKLNDPEHLVFHTKRAMEQGRKVQELRTAVRQICDSQRYRDADVRNLLTKMKRLEDMLPMQSRVVQLPFENTANGFDLLSDGATALVPELTGYAGVDVIRVPPSSAPTAAATAATGTAATPATPAPGISITSTMQTSAATTVSTTLTPAGSIADVFVLGKYISILDSKVIAGGKSAAFEILSREVVHVQIPGGVIPTRLKGPDGEETTYVEIYIATPNGVSNSVMIPYEAFPAPPPIPNAYALAPGSRTMSVFYQWLAVNQQNALVGTAAPAPDKIVIHWDNAAGVAPRRLQVQFTATVNGQTFTFYLQADGGATGDYSIDGRYFVISLLQQLQPLLAAPGAAPSSIAFNLAVQPWTPADAENFRVSEDPKPLKDQLTVKMQYYATGKNALSDVVIPAPPPPAKPHASLSIPARRPGAAGRDAALMRAGQSSATGAALPPRGLSLPERSEPLEPAPLLAPNMSNESEQVAKMLTGQPLSGNSAAPPGRAAAIQAGAQIAAAELGARQVLTGSNNTALEGLPPLPASATHPIVVMPAPVVVVSPPNTSKDKRTKSRLHPSRIMSRLGNRVSELTSGVPRP